MSRHGSWNGSGGSAATPSTHPRDVSSEHRCSQCFSMYGKSAIRCPNEPEGQS